MSIWQDLLGTTANIFGIGKTGPKIKNNAGVIELRNNADSANAELTTAQLNNSGNSIVLNSDAAESGADWNYKLTRPATGMTTNVELILPANGVIGGTYAFSQLIFSSSSALLPPRIVLSTPTSYQIDGVLIGNGLAVSTLDFTTSGTVNNLTLTNLVNLVNGTIIGTFTGALSLPALEVSTNINFAATYSSVSIPALIATLVGFTVANSTTLTSVDAPSYKYCFGAMSFNNNTVLTTINLPVIKYIYGGISISNGSASITSFSLGTSLKIVTGNVNITTATLDQTSVDNILIALAALDGTGGTTAYSSPRTITIIGPSSAPSAASNAARIVLGLRGVTVTTN